MDKEVLKTLSQTWISGEENYVLFEKSLTRYIRPSSEKVKYPTGMIVQDGELKVSISSCTGRSLYLWQKKNKVPFIEAKLCVLYQLSLALRELGENSLVHGNLNPELVNISDEGYLSIVEPGLILSLSEVIEKEDVFGAHDYLAPEVLSSKAYSQKSDMYSFGVLAYELLTGRYPQQEKLDAQSLCSYIPDKLNLLIMSCLKESPNERFDCEKVVKELRELMKSYDFLEKKNLFSRRKIDDEELQRFSSLKKKTLLGGIETCLSYLDRYGEGRSEQDRLYVLLTEYKDVFSVDSELEKIYERLELKHLNQGHFIKRQRLRRLFVFLVGLVFAFALYYFS